jgi:hypothetical protein
LVFRPESSGTRNPLYFYLSAAMLPVIVLNLSLQYVIIAPFQVFIYCISLFFFSLVCHGELAATAPDWQYATRFYLIVSLGGVVGAIFVNFIAPWAFSEYFELHLGVLLLTVILMVNFIKGINKYIKKRRIVRSLLFFFVPFFLVLAFGFYLISDLTFNRLLYKSRNFFGIQRVVEEESKNGVKRLFFSNNTIHGFHPLGEGQGKIPNAYYGDGSGVGAAFTYLLARQPSIAVGDVGLGVGTIAAWGRSGDSFRFYEINPAVPKVADTWFNFLSATSAEVQIIIGDGRLSLEKENTHRFDLLVLDAFNGDGIPAHLLTKEAFVIWLRHLDNDGIIAANISNQHLYLRPIFVQLAKHFELHLQTYEQAANLPAGLFHNQWVLLSRKGEIFADPHLQKGISKIPTKIEIPLWTDDYSNIFEIMKWRYGVE